MAREGLLLQEDGNGPEQPAPAPETPKKKAENFWYYHKWHILVLLLAVVVASFLIRDMMRPKADYEIGMITAYTCPQDAIDLLQKQIEKYGEDLNGDGRVIVQINNYTVEPNGGGTQAQIAGQVKLEADLSTGESMLFFTDEDSFAQQQEKIQMFAKTDGSTPEKGENGPEGMRVPVSELKALSGLSYQGSDGVNPMDGLGLSLRIYQGSAVDGKHDGYWEASRRLFQKLASG
ncbi:hypothetical protein A7X67_00945 [Clostridium sp. W14A]|nr:hypothetical protein A7X67_00945 [Clostridium sp. W14A]